MLLDSPVLVLMGARQVGKSTLVKELCSQVGNVKNVNIDRADTRAAAEADPDAFVDQSPGGLLAIDEVQRVPQLLLSIKVSLAENSRLGRFMVIGSSNLNSLKVRKKALRGRLKV